MRLQRGESSAACQQEYTKSAMADSERNLDEEFRREDQSHTWQLLFGILGPAIAAPVAGWFFQLAVASDGFYALLSFFLWLLFASAVIAGVAYLARYRWFGVAFFISAIISGAVVASILGGIFCFGGLICVPIG